MDDNEFENIIKKAIDELPKEFKEKMENVSIVFSDYPTARQMREVQMRGRGLLLGLYQGVPQTRRGNYGIGGALPDKITIFKIPLLTISRNYEEAVENIKSTVIHEIDHHFGMSDEDISKAKIKKGV
jgi:predicted Zn-dependent protease with MMP-like domain